MAMIIKKKALVALSGGVDSAVSAYLLLRQGYAVEAAFMKNWSSKEGLKYDECPWLTDRQDALRVAAFLGIRMHTLDFEKQYTRKVMKYFFNEYKAGHTPNPDVMCNKEIKFKLLYDWAMKQGFDYMATGHYARVQAVSSKQSAVSKKSKTKSDYNLQSTTYNLLRSVDEFKDQTYFIYNIQTEQLPHLLFPIGAMLKGDVRKLARKIGLPNADRKESMGLCFVGKIRLKDFLEQKLKPKVGPIVDAKGKKIGEHQGLHYYTIGQREGIRVGPDGPWYVAKKDLAKNTLVVTNNPKDKLLQVREVKIHSVNWVEQAVGSKLASNEQSRIRLQGRYRHQQELQKLTIKLNTTNKTNRTDRTYTVTFAKFQTAVASGQSLVLYRDSICIGGGVIV